MEENDPNTGRKEERSSRGEMQVLTRVMMEEKTQVQSATEIQESTEPAHEHREDALGHASEGLDPSPLAFQTSFQIGNLLLEQNNQEEYRALLRNQHQLRTSYGAFLETVQSAPEAEKRPDDGSDGRTWTPGLWTGTQNGEAVTDRTSHHKQLETVRSEENIGGAFLTQRRRSPRHSLSSFSDGRSPLLSEEELNVFQPVPLSPGSGSSSRFTNRIAQQNSPGSDSDVEGAARPPSP